MPDPEWPNSCPSDCPPSSAIDASEAPFFRLVKTNPPRDTDWLSHAELNASPGADPCDRCGLSGALATEPLRQLQKRIPRRRTNSIAVATLPKGAGVIGQTEGEDDPDHFNLWVRVAARPIGQYFRVIADA